MQEFENLVYIDFQKAASSTIVRLLPDIIAERMISPGRHSKADADHDTSKFHFITIRDPASIYISLFGHGCSKRGGLRSRMATRGYAGIDDLYVPTVSGFEKWLDFMLDPKNAQLIRGKYEKNGLAPICGPITDRLISLSIVDPDTVLRKVTLDDRDKLREFFHAHRLYENYARVENLVADLFEIIQVSAHKVKYKQEFASPVELGSIVPKSNVGAKIDGLRTESISAELSDRIRDREWLIYDVFGYAHDRKGSPSPLPARVPATQIETPIIVE